MAIRDSALLRRWASSGAQRAPTWFLRSMPPIIGIFFAVTAKASRDAVLRNLRLIHGRRAGWEEARDVAQTFCNFARALTQSLAPERGLYQLEKHRVRGRQHVANRVHERKGMLIITAHVGPWDVAAVGLAGLFDSPVMMLMAPEQDPNAGEYHDRLRLRGEVQVLRVGNSSLDALPALQHLTAGGIVVAQFDRVVPGGKNIVSSLFGQPFQVPQGLFQLAALAKVPLVPIFHAQLGRDRQLVEVKTPIFVPRRPSTRQLQECAGAALRELESHLAAFPTQWFHFVPPRDP